MGAIDVMMGRVKLVMLEVDHMVGIVRDWMTSSENRAASYDYAA